VEEQCLNNWWSAFPELRDKRYYLVQLGDSICLLNLDSNFPPAPGSDLPSAPPMMRRASANTAQRASATQPKTAMSMVV
jgi:hypothetical protein